MVQFSAIIPVQDSGPALRRQVPEVCAVLDRLAKPYEVLCVDNGSALPTRTILKRLSLQFRQLQVLRHEHPPGVSAALDAGMAAATGKVLIAIEPGPQYPAAGIYALLSQLARADLVFGRRRLSGGAMLRHCIARIPRWLAFGLDVHDPSCLFWAARREAIEDVRLNQGMFRYLPLLVRARGYRVGDVYVEHCRDACSVADGWARPRDVLSAMWQLRASAAKLRPDAVRRNQGPQTAHKHAA